MAVAGRRTERYDPLPVLLESLRRGRGYGNRGRSPDRKGYDRYRSPRYGAGACESRYRATGIRARRIGRDPNRHGTESDADRDRTRWPVAGQKGYDTGPESDCGTGTGRGYDPRYGFRYQFGEIRLRDRMRDRSPDRKRIRLTGSAKSSCVADRRTGKGYDPVTGPDRLQDRNRTRWPVADRKGTTPLPDAESIRHRARDQNRARDRNRARPESCAGPRRGRVRRIPSGRASPWCVHQDSHRFLPLVLLACSSARRPRLAHRANTGDGAGGGPIEARTATGAGRRNARQHAASLGNAVLRAASRGGRRVGIRARASPARRGELPGRGHAPRADAADQPRVLAVGTAAGGDPRLARDDELCRRQGRVRRDRCVPSFDRTRRRPRPERARDARRQLRPRPRRVRIARGAHARAHARAPSAGPATCPHAQVARALMREHRVLDQRPAACAGRTRALMREHRVLDGLAAARAGRTRALMREHRVMDQRLAAARAQHARALSAHHRRRHTRVCTRALVEEPRVLDQRLAVRARAQHPCDQCANSECWIGDLPSTFARAPR